MISKFKADGKTLREYRAKFIKTGTSKNGGTYTSFQISYSKPLENDQWKYTNYTVLSWQTDLNICDGDKITFQEMTDFEAEETEYNGKKYLNRTIVAKINVIPANPNKVEVVGDLPNFDDDSDMGLPF